MKNDIDKKYFLLFVSVVAKRYKMRILYKKIDFFLEWEQFYIYKYT